MSVNILAKPRLYVQREIQQDSAYLLPLRLFIGIGWIRACLEKFITAGWPNGTSLVEFFNQQLSGGQVVFPFYRDLITQVFAPNALALSWIIMIGQLLVGMAIMFGALTNFALLMGMFMNLNFILAGMITPSAFYIVIQAALLVANTGAVFGLDYYLSRYLPFSLISAQRSLDRKFWRLEKACFSLAAVLAVFIGAASIPFIQDYSPHSVDDPAMLMLVLSVITGLTALVTSQRIKPREQAEEVNAPDDYQLEWAKPN